MKTNEIVASASSSRSDMLRDVREKIEKGWTVNAEARDCYGNDVDGDDTEAVCWCLAGAALSVGGDIYEIASFLDFEQPADMMRWNDEPGRTQAEVLARIDQALERAGGGDPSSSTGAA